jgi:hypothetical protein
VGSRPGPAPTDLAEEDRRDELNAVVADNEAVEPAPPLFGGGVAPPADLPFSLGAAGVTVLWMFFHGRAGLGVLLLAGNVALKALAYSGSGGFLLAMLIGWTLSIAFGFSGSRMAWENRHYRTVEELRQGENGWSIAGGIFLVLNVVLTVFGLANLK